MVKEITRERVFLCTMYETADGEVFESKEVAEKHEKSYACIIKGLFMSIPHVITSSYEMHDYGDEYDEIYIMKPRDLNDIKVINEYFNFVNDRKDNIIVDSTVIDKEIMLMLAEDESWMQYLGTVEKYQEMTASHLQKKIKELEEKQNETKDNE